MYTLPIRGYGSNGIHMYNVHYFMLVVQATVCTCVFPTIQGQIEPAVCNSFHICPTYTCSTNYIQGFFLGGGGGHLPD